MNSILIIILSITVFSFILDKYLDYRNIKCAKCEIPNVVKDIYDTEQYNKQQDYLITNTKFSFITSLFTTLLSLMLFLFYIYGSFHNYCMELTNNVFISDLLCIVFFTTLSTIFMLPFNLYDTFIIENKFGFNKMTGKLLIKDTLINLFLSLIIPIIFFSVVYWSYILLGMWFILIAFIFIMIFSFIMTFLYSDIIVPLFNKQTPLEDGELKTKIIKFANEVNFNILDIYVIDSSKRTTKPNAYFTGFGKKKRIVLYDTLIQTLNVDEIIAVIAHEIGHYKHKHIFKSYILNGIETLVSFILLALVLKYININDVMHNITFSLFLTIIVFDSLKEPISTCLNFISTHYTRKHEFQADTFAKNKGYGEQLISALKKLSKNSLSNLTPDKWYVKFNYTHPTLIERIKNIKK